VTPAAALRLDLDAARRAGLPFEDAWPVATARAVHGQRADERAEWSAAFTATAAAWSAAWHGRAATRAQRAVHALAVDDERVAMPEHGACSRCDAPLPPPRHGQTRKWCSDGCRRAASRVSRVAVAA
jgi:RNA polymerase-binding transcription factor DksA